MKSLLLILCICLMQTPGVSLKPPSASVPLPSTPSTATPPTSPAGVPSFQLPQKNRIIEFFTFVKDFFVALYDQNFDIVVNMLKCVVNNAKTAYFYLYLAFLELRDFNVVAFLILMYKLFGIILNAPWC